MTDRELLEAMYHELCGVKSDVQSMKAEIGDMKAEMQSMKAEMQDMKADIHILKERMTSLELTIENETNHNIQLLAENHINLVDKLNQAIRVQDKSILYEVQVSGLKARIDVMEREIADIKKKIA